MNSDEKSKKQRNYSRNVFKTLRIEENNDIVLYSIFLSNKVLSIFPVGIKVHTILTRSFVQCCQN